MGHVSGIKKNNISIRWTVGFGDYQWGSGIIFSMPWIIHLKKAGRVYRQNIVFQFFSFLKKHIYVDFGSDHRDVTTQLNICHLIGLSRRHFTIH